MSKKKSEKNAPLQDRRPESSKKLHPMSKRERTLTAPSKPAVIAAAATKTTKSTAAETLMTQRTDSSLNNTKDSTAASGGIVKTVVLPYDEINNIKSELEYLKQYRE